MSNRVTHFHLFCGSGAGAAGFQGAHARVGTLEAQMECLGGIDSDPTACKDFTRFLGVEATCLDLFSEDQYRAFHGRSPPKGWHEATADDVRQAAGGAYPDIVFTSPPCKGFSGLLSAKSAASTRYQALNRLTVRGIRLMLEAFSERLPSLVILENVPRITNRGGELLDDIRHELGLAGYRVAETFHDCGEIGGLAQHRRRFLLVARHEATIRPFLYEPPRHRVRGVGEVIGALPLPDDPAGGPMHRCPRLQWRTWVRLALVPAGGDWRSLERMDFSNFAVVPQRAWGGGDLGVLPWDGPAGTIGGESWPRNGAYSVADPRSVSSWAGKGKYLVTGWEDPTGAVIGASSTGNGASAVADVRTPRFNNVYRLIRWDSPTQAVTAGAGPSSGGQAVADPRPPAGVVERDGHVYGVTDWSQPAEIVTSKAAPGSGRFSVADPRVGSKSLDGDFLSAGHYGVVPWQASSAAVTGSACHDNGAWSVADPRLPALPADDDRPDPVPWIIALDGTWHRPLTTLDLAALQGYPVEDLMIEPLHGTSDTGWREHIGNSVPLPAAQAIGSVMAETILRARTGYLFQLDSRPVWVRRLATAASLA